MAAVFKVLTTYKNNSALPFQIWISIWSSLRMSQLLIVFTKLKAKIVISDQNLNIRNKKQDKKKNITKKKTSNLHTFGNCNTIFPFHSVPFIWFIIRTLKKAQIIIIIGLQYEIEIHLINKILSFFLSLFNFYTSFSLVKKRK